MSRIAAIYARVSTDEQAEKGSSLESQEEKCRAFASIHNWIVSDVYIDDGYSGKSLDRPALQRLLRDAAAKKFDTVITYRTDRLSRRIADITRLVLEDFDRLGIVYRSATEPFDTSTPAGRLMFTMLGSFADFERESILERTKTGMQKAFDRGIQRGKPPYGYTKIADGSWAVVDDQAEIVRRIYTMYHTGNGINRIAKILNSEGRTGPTGKAWNAKTIQGILTNPTYTGRIVNRFITVENPEKKKSYNQLKPFAEWKMSEERVHPQIINDEEFDLAYTSLKSKAKEKKRTWADSALLAGLLVCPSCRGRMYSYVSGHPDAPWLGYRCANRPRGLCDQKPIRSKLVDPAVEQAVFKGIHSLSTLPNLGEILFDMNKQAQSDSNRDIEKKVLHQQLTENSAAARKLMRLIEQTETPPTTILDRLVELETERKEIQARLFAIEGTSQSDDATKLNTEILAQTIQNFEAAYSLAEPADRKRLLGYLVKAVRLENGQVVIEWAHNVGDLVEW